MTSLDPQRPLHDPSPEARARAARMVWLIVLGLPTLVGVMVAYLTFKGRQVRDYGEAVLREVAARPAPLQGSVPCGEVVGAQAPDAVQSCMVSALGPGEFGVVLHVEGERQYRLKSMNGQITNQVGPQDR